MTVANSPFKLTLITIVRGITPDEVPAHLSALVEEGWDAIEIPLNSLDWERSIGLAAQSKASPAGASRSSKAARAAWKPPCMSCRNTSLAKTRRASTICGKFAQLDNPDTDPGGLVVDAEGGSDPLCGNAAQRAYSIDLDDID
jgi:hypothetical protein